MSLFDSLPEGYIAEPQVHLGSAIEIDVGTFEQEGQPGPPVAGLSRNNGGVAAQVWSPPSPTMAVATDLPTPDEYEVRVYDVSHGRRLVAAVEVVSPSNKDRPEHRRAFVAKCATLLHARVCVAVVDLVTVRSTNLGSALMEFLGQPDPFLDDGPPPLYATCSRWTRRDDANILETWAHPLAIGQPLPTLPLWIAGDFSVPLELERTYEETCRVLRIS